MRNVCQSFMVASIIFAFISFVIGIDTVSDLGKLCTFSMIYQAVIFPTFTLSSVAVIFGLLGSLEKSVNYLGYTFCDKTYSKIHKLEKVINSEIKSIKAEIIKLKSNK